jgi:succinate dehydrogenase/fumarate reductase flavoprotein subunit
MKEETFDVVVIGGGGSGLAAASEAARLGAQVLLIEKNAQLGGSTAWSVGSVSATQTRPFGSARQPCLAAHLGG